MAKTNPKPTELAITLAAVGHRYASEGTWLCASQVAANLALLGFDTNARALAATLTRMCTVECPWLERRQKWGSEYEYRITAYGRTDVENKMPRVRLRVGAASW